MRKRGFESNPFGIRSKKVLLARKIKIGATKSSFFDFVCTQKKYSNELWLNHRSHYQSNISTRRFTYVQMKKFPEITLAEL